MVLPVSGRLAFVEDSDEDFALYRRVFAKHGELCRWSSGEQALTDLEDRGGEPVGDALFVVDLNLPGIDGVEVVRRLRALDGGSRLVICMVTSSDRQSDRDRASAAGADGYLIKPSDLAGLRDLPRQLAQIAADRAA